jgi:hypothetical protein
MPFIQDTTTHNNSYHGLKPQVHRILVALDIASLERKILANQLIRVVNADCLKSEQPLFEHDYKLRRQINETTCLQRGFVCWTDSRDVVKVRRDLSFHPLIEFLLVQCCCLRIVCMLVILSQEK